MSGYSHIIHFQGRTAIPLVTLGMEVGDTEECEDWPSSDYSHICDQKCLAVSNDWIAANKLDDIFPDVSTCMQFNLEILHSPEMLFLLR